MDKNRTLFDIITNAKDGIMPTHEECYYALLTYEAMFNVDHRALRDELNSEKESKPFVKKLRAENSFVMYKNALNKPPKDFLGWNNDPKNPEYQKFRKAGEKLFDKIVCDIEREQG